ncbi:MAG: MGMT family protein [Gemmatimonadota bacterium]|nr:MGMT family protein [Gemmatimonadota bacterium]
MPEFERAFQRIYRMVGRIPEGTVATYGQIAGIVGVGPRQVGQALKALPAGTRCPWHRVINSRGTVSIRTGDVKARLIQERLLEAEGVTFVNGKVDLEVYRWHADL